MRLNRWAPPPAAGRDLNLARIPNADDASPPPLGDPRTRVSNDWEHEYVATEWRFGT